MNAMETVVAVNPASMYATKKPKTPWAAPMMTNTTTNNCPIILRSFLWKILEKDHSFSFTITQLGNEWVVGICAGQKMQRFKSQNSKTLLKMLRDYFVHWEARRFPESVCDNMSLTETYLTFPV